MLKFCEVQKINMTIKEGFKSLTTLKQEVRSTHEDAKKKDERLYQGLIFA